jgi:predicted transcriptional regulator
MASAKDQMREIIEKQPDDSSYDEILRELAFARMVQRGLEDPRAGRAITDEEMRHRIRTWQR